MKTQNSKVKTQNYRSKFKNINKIISNRIYKICHCEERMVMRNEAISLSSNLKLLSGFTFIEILVSFSVLMILVTASFAGYASLSQRQTLQSAGQNMKNILRDAQSRAYNGEIDCSPSVCNCSSTAQNLEGWYVDFSGQKMYGKCASVTFSPRPFGLSGDIYVTPYITPPTELFFKSYPPGVSSDATICLSYKNLAGKFYRIKVNGAGSIYDDGGLVETCTP